MPHGDGSRMRCLALARQLSQATQEYAETLMALSTEQGFTQRLAQGRILLEWAPGCPRGATGARVRAPRAQPGGTLLPTGRRGGPIPAREIPGTAGGREPEPLVGRAG